jgi:hypothetical protein
MSPYSRTLRILGSAETSVGGTDVGGTAVGGTDVGGTDVEGTEVAGADSGVFVAAGVQLVNNIAKTITNPIASLKYSLWVNLFFISHLLYLWLVYLNRL